MTNLAICPAEKAIPVIEPVYAGPICSKAVNTPGVCKPEINIKYAFKRQTFN